MVLSSGKALAAAESAKALGPTFVALQASKGAVGTGLSTSLGAMAGPASVAVLVGCGLYYLVRKKRAEG
ncbi:MAG: hypothetical protein HQL50_13450 [Magnetococcales bacterium]|nr:hypothetical protein [Magnetococcales bacterium]